MNLLNMLRRAHSGRVWWLKWLIGIAYIRFGAIADHPDTCICRASLQSEQFTFLNIYDGRHILHINSKNFHSWAWRFVLSFSLALSLSFSFFLSLFSVSCRQQMQGQYIVSIDKRMKWRWSWSWNCEFVNFVGVACGVVKKQISVYGEWRRQLWRKQTDRQTQITPHAC